MFPNQFPFIRPVDCFIINNIINNIVRNILMQLADVSYYYFKAIFQKQLLCQIVYI